MIIPFVLLFAGCGSGSEVSLPQQTTAAAVVFSATNAPLAAAVTAFEITAKMPEGASVRIRPGTTNEIDAGSLVPRLGNSLLSGSYSVATREVTLFVLPLSVPTDWGLSGNIGQFAEIKVDCLPGVTKSSFTAINPSFPGFKASDGTTNNPTPLFTATMDVTF